MQDVFDEEDLGMEEMYSNKKWSEIEEETKKVIVDRVKNSLISRNKKVPSEKVMINRVKGFYSNRRGIELIKLDPEKAKRRRFETKKNRLTFVSLCFSQ